MIKRFIFWLRYEFPYYTHLTWLVIFKKVDLEMLARMNYTEVLLDDWTDKIALKNALKRQDMGEIQNILKTVKTTENFHEEDYMKFLRRIKRYEIFYIIILALILFLLVLLIEGGIRL